MFHHNSVGFVKFVIHDESLHLFCVFWYLRKIIVQFYGSETERKNIKNSSKNFHEFLSFFHKIRQAELFSFHEFLTVSFPLIQFFLLIFSNLPAFIICKYSLFDFRINCNSASFFKVAGITVVPAFFLYGSFPLSNISKNFLTFSLCKSTFFEKYFDFFLSLIGCKSSKMSHCTITILAFSTIFAPFKLTLFDCKLLFKKITKLTIF